MNGRIVHNCAECEKQIEQILDRACSSVEKTHFLQHIESCPRCMGKYQREESFKVFLKNRIPQKRISPTILSSIRSQIRGER